jgi:hypothetical protein
MRADVRLLVTSELLINNHSSDHHKKRPERNSPNESGVHSRIMSALNLNSSDCYDVLGCSRDDDHNIVKRAYLKLARMVCTFLGESDFQAF